MPATPGLEVQDLSVRFPAPRGAGRGLLSRLQIPVVDGISLYVPPGKLVALVGESGCGKTTTANAILRLVEPAGGTIRLNDTEISAIPHRRLRETRRRMQLVYQDPYESLDPRCRVRAIIEEPIRIHKLARSPEERRRMVHDALERVGLRPASAFADRHPHELSGGQRQRVAIAASLSLSPDLLIVDEPVSMLDVSVRASILDLLCDLRTLGMAILMITHDLATVAQYADGVAVMYLGRIVEQGPAEVVIENPKHPYTKALLSAVPSFDDSRRQSRQLLPGEIPDPLHLPTGCRFRNRCPIAADVCAEQDPQLRELDGSTGHAAACLLAS